MGFHPDRLLSPTTSKPVRSAYWTAKYLVTIALGYGFIVGLAALFEPSAVNKAIGGLAAITAAIGGHWLWRAKK